MKESKTDIRDNLLRQLAKLSRQGPIPAVSKGDTAIGMTLLNALGIDYTSSAKPNFHGIVITAQRRSVSGKGNRVNLFAQVADWSISTCKSSRKILEKYGYVVGGVRRLNCTVISRHPNSQGLFFIIDRRHELLNEIAQVEGNTEAVATWRISKLRERLVETHPASIWVKAVVSTQHGHEHFHYREAVYAGPPKHDELLDSLDAGTVTMDHLITLSKNRVIEKGPLFKIHPSNLEVLFPTPKKYDLMSLT